LNVKKKQAIYPIFFYPTTVVETVNELSAFAGVILKIGVVDSCKARKELLAAVYDRGK
jgi:hypothetical protein